MKAANIVLLNFHDMGAKVAKWMELTEVVRTPEEMQAKELQRAKNQNPGLQRFKADDGVPALGRYGEANVRIERVVQDLLDAGFRLIEAYKEHTFKTRWEDDVPHVTDEKIGTKSRFVFSKDPTSVAVLDPETAEKKLACLFEGLRDGKGYTCPCVHVFHNFAEDKVARTTDTINLGKLDEEDERVEVETGYLRYTAGMFTISRRRADRYHNLSEHY